jgi:hypothetical protein
MNDILINVLENICIFFFVSLMSWKHTKKDVLSSHHFGHIFVLTIAVNALISNLVQFLFDYYMPNPAGKMLSILIVILFLCATFNFVYGVKKIPSVLYTLFTFGIIFCSEVILIGFMYFIDKNMFSQITIDKDLYIKLCIISIIIKYFILFIFILVIEPSFFAKFFRRRKDKGMQLLASTVTTLARAQASFPSWLWFYQARTPKSLRRKE